MKDIGAHTHPPWHLATQAVQTATLSSTLWIGQPRSPPPGKSPLHASRCHLILGSEGDETGPPPEGRFFCSETDGARGRGAAPRGQRKQEWGSGSPPKPTFATSIHAKRKKPGLKNWGGPLGRQRTASRCACLDPQTLHQHAPLSVAGEKRRRAGLGETPNFLKRKNVPGEIPGL